MARKSAKAAGKAGSTATIFKDVSGTEDPRLKKLSQRQESPKSEETITSSSETSSPFGDDPYSQPFPINHIFATQDFLNEHLDFAKGSQILLFLFLAQLIYNSKQEFLPLYLEKVVMNYTGVLVGTVFTYNLTWKKHLQGTADKPSVPEFNVLYSIVITNLFCLRYGFNVIENLSYNYFTIGTLPIAVKGFSSLVFYFLYAEDDDIAGYIRRLIAFTMFNMALEYVNQGDEDEENIISKEVQKHEDVDFDLVEVDDGTIKSGFNKTLSKAEVQVIVFTLVNLIFNLKIEDVNLTILQKLLVSVIASSILTYPVFKINKLFSAPVFAGIFYFFTNYQLEPILKQNSITWILDVILQEKNFKFFGLWALILITNILVVFSLNIEFNLRRKIWHFVILLTILPGLIFNKSFTILALFGLLIILILTEIIRANKISFIGRFIHDQLYKFQDFKDLKGPLNVSYIYLVIGVVSPIVLYDLCNGTTDELNLKQTIGLVSLGVSDSFASIIGQHFGKHKIFDGHKTVEGSVAFFISSMGAYYAIDKYLNLNQINWEVLFVTNVVISIFEGTTTLNDNLFVPIFQYVVWDVLDNTVR